MPSATLKSLAKKAGKDLDRAEHLWDKAKDIVAKEYKLGKKDKKFWPLVVGVTKKMLGLREAVTFKECVQAEIEDEIFEANKFTASDSDKYKVGDKVLVNAGGKWWDGTITKPPHEETKNYGVRFKYGTKTANSVASEDELKKL